MGAEGSKNTRNVSNVRKEYFTPEERQSVTQAVHKLAKGDNVAFTALERHIASHLNHETTASKFVKIVVKSRPGPSLPVSTVVDTLGPLLKGSLEEHLFVTLTLAGGGQAGVETDAILKYTQLILSSYVHLVGGSKNKSWRTGSVDQIAGVCHALLHDLFHAGATYKEVWEKPITKTRYSYEQFEKWCLSHTIFTTMETEVLKACFPYSPVDPHALLPQPCLTPKAFPNLLSSSQVLLLNSALPAALRSQWRFLFSTHTHGSSFSIFMKQIVGKGPTLIVLEDQSGNKFGGFASVSWEVRPQFQGTPECFLFALEPQAGIFHSTGYNNNFMYLNFLEKNTMPNGLGMGGCEELFGFWLDYDFGKGTTSPSCTTFRSPPLSQHRELEVQSLEVWALGPPEEDSDEEEGTRKKKSALDKNPEARAMLDLMGKERASDGYRDPDEDKDQ